MKKREDPDKILDDIRYWGEEHFTHRTREFVEQWAKAEEELKKTKAKLRKKSKSRHSGGPGTGPK